MHIAEDSVVQAQHVRSRGGGGGKGYLGSES